MTPIHLQFPLTLAVLKFRVGRQVIIAEATGRVVLVAKAAVIAARESISVYTDEEAKSAAYECKSDSLTDFNATFALRRMNDNANVGTLRIAAKASMRTEYELARPDDVAYKIREENPSANFIANTIGAVPLIGNIVGYFFNTRFAITKSGRPVAMFERERAFFSEIYHLRTLGQLDPQDAELLALGAAVMAILEGNRV